MESLRVTIKNTISWLTDHPQQENDFSSKKNDQLLQNLVNDLINYAELKMSSDIHLEPQENGIRIRLRIDGVLSEHFQAPKYIYKQFCCKLKILANIDIAQTRLPQDGKFIFHLKNNLQIHIRMSTCPTVLGEKIVLRLLKDNKGTLNLSSLGMNPEQLTVFSQAISSPHGLVLITGPTGSGKTSTLYSALSNINVDTKNIITIEDPVEVHIPGINQININIKADLTFSSALRSILRQDPDVIMIGEIRDEETAQIATQAANTGHLVLATLHTNNCIETVNRLKQMNIDQNELISCLRLIVSQRLLRKKCTKCDQGSIRFECECTDGYHGRFGVFEALYFNESLKYHMIQNPYCNELNLIQNYQFTPLNQQVMECIRYGITSPEEAKRALNIC
jgi:type II secretory ATPase GspE/PulE/Tfp pilus assembly ATPase PilB-like protein